MLSATFLTACFFAFLASLSGLSWCANSRCASRSSWSTYPRPPRSSTLLSVLSVASCNATSQFRVWGSSFGHMASASNRRLRLRKSFALALCGPCLVNHGLPDALTASFTVQSYLSAHLRCAADALSSLRLLAVFVSTRPAPS